MAGTEHRNRNRLRKGGGGLVSDDGLTNGAEGPSKAMEVDVGLINGLPNDGARSRTGSRPLFGRLKRKRRAAREALERKAREPLPGAGDE